MPLILRLLLLTIIGHQHRALVQSYALMRAERDYYRSLVPKGDVYKRQLKDNNFDPGQRKLTRPESNWKPFITEHGDKIAGMDFLQTDVWDWLGKHTVYVLFLIHIKTRRVEIAGITEHPTADWMKQVARNLTMEGVGFFPITGTKYLIRDNDEIYQPSFEELLRTAGVEPVKIAPNSPNLNSFAERWVRLSLIHI